MSDPDQDPNVQDPNPPSSAPAGSSRPDSHRGPALLSTLIAMAALFLSVSTAVIDLRHSRSQARHAAGLELTDLVQRLVALPRQYAEAARVPGVDIELLEAGFGQEKTALAARAVGIIQDTPSIASSSEYEVVAEARVTNIHNAVVHREAVNLAVRLLETGVRETTDVQQKASLLARAGGILFRIDDYSRARELYRRSVNTVSQDNALRYVASYYEALWGRWEASRNQCDAARQHLELARTYLRESGDSGSSEGIDDLVSRIDRCSNASKAPSAAPQRSAGTGG